MLTISHPELPDHTELDVAPDQVQRGDVVQFLLRGKCGGSRQGGRVVAISRTGVGVVRFDFEAEGDYCWFTIESKLRIARPQHEGALQHQRTVIVTED